VDTNIFFPNQIKQRQSKCIFFNAGKFEVRKGHLELAQAFELAFKDNDEVELWLCCDNRFYKNNENNWWKQYFREFCGNRVKFIPWQDTDGQIAKIMRQVSVGVFPAKAEGWNLELLETMSCGIPCIATNYSGHTEFCTSDNCDLIPITKLEPAIDKCPCHPNGFWFNGFGEWASVDINILAEFMVSAYNKWKDGYVNVAGIETGKKYDWSNVANILIERLKQWN
jgi:glycosyltransferase involved in cell wall biosynthesis